MSQNRREFLKTIAAIGASTAAISSVTPKKTIAKTEPFLSEDRKGVLVDTTVCIGCRKCEWACKGAHGFEQGDFENYQNDEILNVQRRPSTNNLTVVNKYIDEGTRTVKMQCMHCEHPACVSACIVGAISKKENGSVVWDTDMCIGCRYCMVACPFQIPAFEYYKALDPKIVKCDFCIERTSEGKLPACVNICPVEALTYGTRNELIDEAKRRIKNHPDKYFDHVFGEYEVGGTSWLYLADKNLAGNVFPKLGNNTAPGVSESIQHGIFAYFVPPIAVYALLGGIMWLTKEKETKKENK
ncbi:MAG: 4Fe-4S dicluster domain-containing protein [Ignavibacteriae bacterium]|nr:4Fe-4S dicluster domain-containing protein [Ignavibacteriota bacterium]MCB9209185.1 4Fe-4S dicluster domain-containing protein [Ignavibacteriales bacterium]MCB9219565.1 4Fe-4S dicluster domain-containing protein [Ignavibacteriales bacterium]MCB9257833.1 4Fe-4S dicluster domain-containing protein [Ignavibacteriales bacterium]